MEYCDFCAHFHWHIIWNIYRGETPMSFLVIHHFSSLIQSWLEFPLFSTNTLLHLFFACPNCKDKLNGNALRICWLLVCCFGQERNSKDTWLILSCLIMNLNCCLIITLNCYDYWFSLWFTLKSIHQLYNYSSSFAWL